MVATSLASSGWESSTAPSACSGGTTRRSRTGRFSVDMGFERMRQIALGNLRGGPWICRADKPVQRALRFPVAAGARGTDGRAPRPLARRRSGPRRPGPDAILVGPVPELLGVNSTGSHARLSVAMCVCFIQQHFTRSGGSTHGTSRCLGEEQPSTGRETCLRCGSRSRGPGGGLCPSTDLP